MRNTGFCILAVLGAVVAVSGCFGQSTLTPDQLPPVAASLVGTNITLEGLAVAYNVVCTQAACPPETPCCNTCGAPLALAGDQTKIRLRGSYELRPVGCFGTECNQTCYPLTIWQRYQVSGTLLDDGSEYYLEFGGFIGKNSTGI